MRDPFLVRSQPYSPPSGPLRPLQQPYAHPRGQDSPLFAAVAVIALVVLIMFSMLAALWWCCGKAVARFCPSWSPFPNLRSFSLQAPVQNAPLMSGSVRDPPAQDVQLMSGQSGDPPALDVIPTENLEIRPKIFSYEELETASDKFHNILGEGGFGKVYAGRIGQSMVAIKKLINPSKVSVAGFVAEANTLSRLHHRNIVKLVGYCHDNNERLLVYQLVPNGSLDKHLHDPEKPVLPWWRRYTIALDLASALAYIHEDFDPDQSVIHKDIKPSNILIGNNFDARLGDFGLARLVDHDQSMEATNAVGTFGYMDPVPFFRGHEDVKSDMYSFGVILLEMASGRHPTQKIEGEWSHIKDLLLREYRNGRGAIGVVDPRLQGNYVMKQLNAVIRVGLWCVQQEPRIRLSAKEALKALKLEMSLEIPMDTPADRHGTSSVNSDHYSLIVNTSGELTGRSDGAMSSAFSESPSLADTPDVNSERYSLIVNTSRKMTGSGSLVVTRSSDGTKSSAVPEPPSHAYTSDFNSDRSSLNDHTSWVSSVPSPKLAKRRQKVLLEKKLQKLDITTGATAKGTLKKLPEAKYSRSRYLGARREAYDLGYNAKGKEE